MVRRGFDILAPVYDVLAGVVFGKNIEHAQKHFLHEIPTGAHILVLGGGTGNVLAELLRLNPSCTVVYYEASIKMIDKARARLVPSQHDQVRFVHQNEISESDMFDAVVTQFFLDLFPESVLEKKIGQIDAVMRPKGQWIVADFIDNGKRWQKLLLKSMYLFFRFCCGVEASSLPLWKQMLGKAGWHEHERKNFYSGFICSAVFKRNHPKHNRTDIHTTV